MYRPGNKCCVTMVAGQMKNAGILRNVFALFRLYQMTRIGKLFVPPH